MNEVISTATAMQANMSVEDMGLKRWVTTHDTKRANKVETQARTRRHACFSPVNRAGA